MGILEILIGPITKIVDKLIPDPQARAQAQLELIKLQQAGEFKELEAQLEINKGQIDINKIEAASSSFWNSGWRPAVGWICVVGLGYNYLLQPLLSWMSSNFGWIVPPSPPLGELIVLLGGLLGLGTMRSFERVRGKA